MRPSDGGDAPDGAVRSVDRVVDLLEAFDTAHPTRTLRDLQAVSGLPRTTVLRLTATPGARGVLVQGADGAYAPGPALLRWSRLAGRTWTPSEDVMAVLRGLSGQTGETVNLYVRQGLSRVVVAQVESTATVRSVVPLGVPLPLWSGAAGKVLLLDRPDLVEAAAASSGGGVSPEALRAAVEAGRAAGHQVTHGERELGSSGLSFPVRGPRGTVVAALTLGGPTGRFTDDRLEHYLAAAGAAAARITELGVPGID